MRVLEERNDVGRRPCVSASYYSFCHERYHMAIIEDVPMLSRLIVYSRIERVFDPSAPLTVPIHGRDDDHGDGDGGSEDGRDRCEVRICDSREGPSDSWWVKLLQVVDSSDVYIVRIVDLEALF